MRKPSGVRSFIPERHWCPPYLGLSVFETDPYGGGDYLAFYWPIGAERQQPLVARVFHDTLEMAPLFSTYRHYQKWRKSKLKKPSDDADEFDETDDFLPGVEDTASDVEAPEYLLSKGRQLLKAGKAQAAVSPLKAAIDRLPEFSVAWLTLAHAYRKMGKTDKAIDAGLRALISPPTFNRFETLLPWLRKQKEPPKVFAENPIWTNRRKLNWTYKHYKDPKNDFGVIRESIDAFLDSGHPLLAITLMESFAAFIFWEDERIQRKWKYDQEEWMQATDDLCRKHLGTSRIIEESD